MPAITTVTDNEDGTVRIVAGSAYDTAAGKTSVDFTMSKAAARGHVVAVAKALGLHVVHDLTDDA